MNNIFYLKYSPNCYLQFYARHQWVNISIDACFFLLRYVSTRSSSLYLWCLFLYFLQDYIKKRDIVSSVPDEIGLLQSVVVIQWYYTFSSVCTLSIPTRNILINSERCCWNNLINIEWLLQYREIINRNQSKLISSITIPPVLFGRISDLK